MSHIDAVKDNIPMGKDYNGFNCYYPPCHVCGASVPSWNYISGTKYTCRECREILAEQKKLTIDSQQKGKKEKRLDVAIVRISKVADIRKYQNAIEYVRKRLDTPGWFQSTEEVMTALELIRRGIKAYHQVKVYNYSVDFVLPEFKVALEIDGKPFHRKEMMSQQKLRDEVIVNKFGAGWQVIHIDSENININVTKLIPAIKAVLRTRKNKAT